MLLPGTTQAAILLLIVALLCLGSWPNLFKASRWRYELFYFDFAIGAALLAIVCAYTLGTVGSDMSFADRAVVAGTRSQAIAFGAGFTFGLGNLLLLGGIALAGISIAYPLGLSLAFAIAGWSHSNAGSTTFHILSLAAFLAAAICPVFALNWQFQKRRTKAHTTPANSGSSVSIVALCTLAGILIGVSQPLANLSFWGDLGLGAYAGTLLFCLGVAGATAVFNIFFMNMGLAGGRVTLPNYLQASARQHLLGIAAGAMWAAGLLTTLLAHSVPGPLPTWTIWLEQGTVLLAMAWGVFAWRERSSSLKALVVCAAFFVIALALSSIAH